MLEPVAAELFSFVGRAGEAENLARECTRRPHIDE
jgi:hypothetical protein